MIPSANAPFEGFGCFIPKFVHDALDSRYPLFLVSLLVLVPSLHSDLQKVTSMTQNRFAEFLRPLYRCSDPYFHTEKKPTKKLLFSISSMLLN